MARTYGVISADGHLEIPPDAWIRHVPPEHVGRAPRLVTLRGGGEGWIVEGIPMIHNGQNVAAGRPLKVLGGSYWDPDGSAVPGTGDSIQRLQEQDLDGVDAEVLYPPVFVSRFIENMPDKEAYLAMVRAYNTFLAEDYCAIAPDRRPRQRGHPHDGDRRRARGTQASPAARFAIGVPRPVPSRRRHAVAGG
jgi:hypothetical protein